MLFNRHPELEGRHSFLSPSKYAWLRYDDQKLERMFVEHLEHLRGVEEHEYAARAIKLGHKQADEPKTINMYINDSIGWRMKPEVPLYWSDFSFGTADAVGYWEREAILRINDLKTGKNPTKFDQLVIYAGLFCLEYELKPWDLETQLRIYQGNKVKLYEPDPDEIFKAMDRIVSGTRLLEQVRADYMR